MSRKMLGVAPANDADLVNRAYVDQRAVVPVYVQQSQPSGTNVPTTFEWYQTDSSGNIVGHWLYP